MNLHALLHRWFPHPDAYEISGIELGPATITHIGATWLERELGIMNAKSVPLVLPNLDGLVEYPVGRFTALTRKLAGRT